MTWLKIGLMGSLLALFLTACGPEAEDPVATQEIAAVTATNEPTDTPIPEPTATETIPPTPTDEPEPTATATAIPTETPEPVVDDQCLACHQDKDQLIATAAKVEDIPSENSGEG